MSSYRIIAISSLVYAFTAQALAAEPVGLPTPAVAAVAVAASLQQPLLEVDDSPGQALEPVQESAAERIRQQRELRQKMRAIGMSSSAIAR